MPLSRKILMVGGSGFLGVSFISACKDLQVINYDLQTYPAGEAHPESFLDVLASGNNEGDFKALIPEVEAVWIRAGKTGGAASTDINQCLSYLNANTELVLKIAQSCSRYGCNRIFYDSSEQVFGESGDRSPLLPETEPYPVNFYGVSKMISEKYLYQWSQEDRKRSVQIFRYSRVRGGKTSDVIKFMLTCCLDGRPIPLTVDPSHHISFVHIDDVTRANMKALNLSPGYACYHISSGRPISLFDLALRVQVIAERNVGIEIKEGASSPVYEPYVAGMDWELSRQVLGLPMPVSLEEMIVESLKLLKK